MTTFSNPASGEKSAEDEYIRSLLEVLGDRDPMSVLESTVGLLEKAVAGMGDSARRPERPGKWSVAEVVQHLADSELVLGYRVRMVVSQPVADIQSFDQDLWARELEYGRVALDHAMEEFRVLRQSNVRLLRALSPEKLQRFGNHVERGRETVLKMQKLYAGHDLLHLRQVERIRKAVPARAPS